MGASLRGLRDEEDDEDGKGDDAGGRGRLWSINPSGSRLGILVAGEWEWGRSKKKVAKRILSRDENVYCSNLVHNVYCFHLYTLTSR
jgi:hypothetical protein